MVTRGDEKGNNKYGELKSEEMIKKFRRVISSGREEGAYVIIEVQKVGD